MYFSVIYQHSKGSYGRINLIAIEQIDWRMKSRRETKERASFILQTCLLILKLQSSIREVQYLSYVFLFFFNVQIQKIHKAPEIIH